jgi:hypothetical protein
MYIREGFSVFNAGFFAFTPGEIVEFAPFAGCSPGEIGEIAILF